jgi:hypothetical protein
MSSYWCRFPRIASLTSSRDMDRVLSMLSRYVVLGMMMLVIELRQGRSRACISWSSLIFSCTSVKGSTPGVARISRIVRFHLSCVSLAASTYASSKTYGCICASLFQSCTIGQGIFGKENRVWACRLAVSARQKDACSLLTSCKYRIVPGTTVRRESPATSYASYAMIKQMFMQNLCKCYASVM